ncbi:MAG: oligosaccharide flippase family protein [Vulcanisaeta sp.]|uniref:oligosaccharide flippase family protein n=1 Tax=Vulcanisaeta sp. TaxID=2020871 RepID=UPI003D14CAC6
MRESPVSGILFGYLSTAINYAFALAYVIILTRFIPLAQYGYYNAIIAMIGLIGLFFPTLGIDYAIAREGAMIHSNGLNITNHFAALLAISLTVSTLYAVAIVIATPLYIASKIPSQYTGIAYIYAIYVILSSINGAMSSYLWMTGRLTTQGLGYMIGNMAFRSLEIALLLLMRSVYAIVIGMAFGQAVTATYFLARIRHLPNPARGVGLIRRGFRNYINLGIQNWLLGYLGSVGGYAITYITYSFIGAESVALYNLAMYMLGAVTAIGGSVSTVFGSRVARAIGSGADVRHLIRDYAIASIVVSGILASGSVLVAPLLPILGIVHGSYVDAIPYGALLFGTAVLGSINSVYTTYYWVSGRGWLALEVSSTGIAISVALLIALLAPFRWLGLYAVIVSSYVGSLVTTVIYLTLDRYNVLELAVSTAVYLMLPLASAVAYLLINGSWPIYQLGLFAVVILVTYIMRPIPRSVIDQLPGFIKPVLSPFTS